MYFLRYKRVPYHCRTSYVKEEPLLGINDDKTAKRKAKHLWEQLNKHEEGSRRPDILGEPQLRRVEVISVRFE